MLTINIQNSADKLCQYFLKMFNNETTEIWQPYENIVSRIKETNYAIVILNTPINYDFPPSFLMNLWNAAKIRITVDGGTSRWLDWLKVNDFNLDKIKKPDLITGDMDSLPKDVLNHFVGNGISRIINTPDQMETDFTKALKEIKLQTTEKNEQIGAVYVIVDTSGRFDQIMANVNTLYKGVNILPRCKIYLISSESLTWLLLRGSHSISIPLNLRNKLEWCSLIPIGTLCKVTTTGLKWNLNNDALEFGQCVSTSNTYDGSPIVTVKTDNPLIWSMGISNIL